MSLSYVLAKYVPEVMRNEPRNFGVLLWTPWGVKARFLGEDRGLLDGRKIPSWVRSKEAYREWIGSWRTSLIRSSIKTARGGVIESTTPTFIEALAESSHGNYLLADKGSVLDEVSEEDVPALLTFLFETLVTEGADKATAQAAFDIERACNSIIRNTRAYRNPNFHRGKSILCRIAPNVVDEINFDYYVGNGTPLRLYQRVPLGHRLDTTLHASAWQFEKVVQSGLITPDRSAALVYPTPEQRDSDQYQRAVSILETQTRVIDLSVSDDAFAAELDALFTE